MREEPAYRAVVVRGDWDDEQTDERDDEGGRP